MPAKRIVCLVVADEHGVMRAVPGDVLEARLREMVEPAMPLAAYARLFGSEPVEEFVSEMLGEETNGATHER